MSTFALTTTSDVDDIVAGIPSALATKLIAKVSRQIEKYIARDFEQTERTETYDVEPGTRRLLLRQWPVDTGETFEIRFDSQRAFTGDPIDADAFHLKAESGLVELVDVPLTLGPGVAQVVYTGGFATSEGDLQSQFPDLNWAAALQVAHEYRRRDNPGASSVVKGPGQREFTGQLGLLRSVLEVVDAYKTGGAT